ncbi:hypothetical protein ZWY2020_040137 [Hordeum vulgare]|nr:hypothetical protein ZWY2020_040137 [Hordeum vulgare]
MHGSGETHERRRWRMRAVNVDECGIQQRGAAKGGGPDEGVVTDGREDIQATMDSAERKKEMGMSTCAEMARVEVGRLGQLGRRQHLARKNLVNLP